MNILDKIVNIFTGFKFSATAKLLESGKELRIEGNDIVEGAKVFIVTKDAEIPIPDEMWKLDNGYSITTKDGMIVSVDKIEDTPEKPITKPVAAEEASVEEHADTTPVDPATQPDTQEVEPMDPEVPIKLEELNAKLDEILTKLNASMEKYEKVELEIKNTKDEIDHRFEKVSSTPSIKTMDKETPIRKEGSFLGSYEELKKNK